MLRPYKSKTTVCDRAEYNSKLKTPPTPPSLPPSPLNFRYPTFERDDASQVKQIDRGLTASIGLSL